MAERLASALGRSGRTDLAAGVLLLVARALSGHAPRGTERRLFALAVPYLIRSGQRAEAWAAAVDSRSPFALLRCLWP
jgi:hypothetical protein